MISKKTLFILINNSIDLVNQYISDDNYDYSPQKKTLNLLELIKDDLINRKFVRERLLRGYKDTCTTTAIHFEEASYADSIFDVKEALEEMYPKMRELDLLRLDYGKGDPI